MLKDYVVIARLIRSFKEIHLDINLNKEISKGLKKCILIHLEREIDSFEEAYKIEDVGYDIVETKPCVQIMTTLEVEITIISYVL